MEKSEVCNQCFLLFHTHRLFEQLSNPACPICGQPITTGELIHLEPTGDGRIMYSHGECFHFVDSESAV
jgi:hypothetical protein